MKTFYIERKHCIICISALCMICASNRISNLRHSFNQSNLKQPQYPLSRQAELHSIPYLIDIWISYIFFPSKQHLASTNSIWQIQCFPQFWVLNIVQKICNSAILPTQSCWPDCRSLHRASRSQLENALAQDAAFCPSAPQLVPRSSKPKRSPTSELTLSKPSTNAPTLR